MAIGVACPRCTCAVRLRTGLQDLELRLRHHLLQEVSREDGGEIWVVG